MNRMRQVMAALASVTLVAGMAVVAAAPATGALLTVPVKTYKACADKDSGAIRLVVKGKKCTKREIKLSWTVQGPPGLQGPIGPQGPVGPQGPQGAPGATGPAGTGIAVFAGGDQAMDLTYNYTVVRTVSLTPPQDGVVVVNYSASLTRLTGTGASAGCSITTGTAFDPDSIQSAALPNFADPSLYSFATLAGTRGFLVTGGMPFTANLVCTQFEGYVALVDSSITAVFSRAG